MIDYDKINEEIIQKKWERIYDKQENKFTCYYDEYNHHKLCPHPYCILDKEFQKIHAAITQDKKQKKILENIYRDVVKLKKEQPNKSFSKMYVGFNPRENRIKRRLLEINIKKNYKRLKALKTKKGGYE